MDSIHYAMDRDLVSVCRSMVDQIAARGRGLPESWRAVSSGLGRRQGSAQRCGGCGEVADKGGRLEQQDDIAGVEWDGGAVRSTCARALVEAWCARVHARECVRCIGEN